MELRALGSERDLHSLCRSFGSLNSLQRWTVKLFQWRQESLVEMFGMGHDHGMGHDPSSEETPPRKDTSSPPPSEGPRSVGGRPRPSQTDFLDLGYESGARVTV